MTASMEMPRYRSHKEVWALKIAAIEFAEDGSAKIAPVDKGYGIVEVDANFKARFQGNENDLGYYVVYKDGYKSWSPTEAFDEGYTKVD